MKAAVIELNNQDIINTLITVTNGGEVLTSLTGVSATLIGAEDFTTLA